MGVRKCIATIEGVSPYSQSRYHGLPKLEKERPDDYAIRTWRGHLHRDRNGKVMVPPMALKNCLPEAAKFLGKQIPGKGKSTYTKHFEAGVQVLEGMALDYDAETLPEKYCERLFLPSDGVRGSGKRVMKYYPTLPEWGGSAEFYIFDETITEDVFVEVLEEAGKFIGLGRFRPRQNGIYGRFSVTAVEWSREA